MRSFHVQPTPVKGLHMNGPKIAVNENKRLTNARKKFLEGLTEAVLAYSVYNCIQ